MNYIWYQNEEKYLDVTLTPYSINLTKYFTNHDCSKGHGVRANLRKAADDLHRQINFQVISRTLAIRTTVVPIRILIRTTLVPIGILIGTTVVPIRILIRTTGITNTLC